MRFALLFLGISFSAQSWACVEVLENKRIYDMSYNFYSKENVKSCVRLPHTRKDFEAEGLYINEKNIAFISMNDLSGKLPGRIVQADALTGKTLRTYQLMSSKRGYFNKVSSIVLFDNNSKFLVSTQASLCLFDKKNAKKSMDGLYKSSLISCQNQEKLGGAKISFISKGSDHEGRKYIWAIGGKKSSSKIYGYRIAAGHILKAPAYSFSVPSSVADLQSLSFVGSDAKRHRFLLSSGQALETVKMYELEYSYNKDNKKYDYKVKSLFDKKRKVASVAPILPLKNNDLKEKYKGVFLKKNSPLYLYKNLSTLQR